MAKIIQFVVFLCIFFAVYFGMHLYVFLRLTGMMQIKRTFLLYALIAALALSFPVMSLLERFFAGWINRILYTISATWLGVLWLFLWALLAYEIIRPFADIDQRISGFVIIGIVLILSAVSIANAAFVRVNHVDIPIKDLKGQLSIVQLSDLHMGTIHNSGYLKNIVKMTNELKPDMVMITGDLVDGSSALNAKSFSALKNLKPKTFFSTGNHEEYVDKEKAIGFLKKANITVLMNQMQNYKGTSIIGIDDPGNGMRRDKSIDDFKINSSGPVILMYHRPDSFDDAAKKGVDLQLSGHTHDGQIFPFNLITKIFYPRIKGLYELNNSYLYVSPGTGTWGPPMRLGSRSEITYIRLLGES